MMADTPSETVTVDQLADAVKANDRDRVRQILDARPDLIHTDLAYENEHRFCTTPCTLVCPKWSAC